MIHFCLTGNPRKNIYLKAESIREVFGIFTNVILNNFFKKPEYTVISCQMANRRSDTRTHTITMGFCGKEK